jgi:selenocysteine-specific elongation factor
VSDVHFRPSDEKAQALGRAVEQWIGASGLGPPTFLEVCMRFELEAPHGREILRALVERGTIVRVSDTLYFAASALDGLRRKVLDHFETSETLSTADFKRITNQSRKFAMPLAEYLDRVHVTSRVGEARKRGGGQS